MILLILSVGAALIAYGCTYAWSEPDGYGETLSRMKAYYTEWSQYDRGLLYFLGKKLWDMFLLEIFAAVAIVAFLLYFLTFGGAFLFFAILPLWILYGICHGTYLAVQKDGYWLCFGTTLVVTSLIAWGMYQYFDNGRAIWLTALCAGVASAVAVEAIRQGLLVVFEHNRKIRALAIVPMKRRLRPVRKAWEGIGEYTSRILAEPVFEAMAAALPELR